MEITHQEYKHSDVLTVKGRVDSYTAPKLGEAIDKVNGEGRYRIILDLGGLEFMSSAGFRTLLVAQRKCKRYNRGELVLAAVPKRTIEAFELTGFTPLFRFFPDLTSAVGSF